MQPRGRACAGRQLLEEEGDAHPKGAKPVHTFGDFAPMAGVDTTLGLRPVHPMLCLVVSATPLAAKGCRLLAMGEQDKVMADLEQAGVVAGIRWGFLSATDRVLEDYSEAAGHDAAWLGITRFNQFRDRLDRVFACGRYTVPVGGDAAVSLDLLHAELTERDIESRPRLAPDLVVRADLNGSPGWAWQGYRWLLASCAYGKIDQLPWPRKSPTKQRVAQAHNPDQASLFDGFALEEVPGLVEALAAPHQLDLETFVIAHTQDVDHEACELVLGRARLNIGGGEAWHWRRTLLGTPRADGGRLFAEGPTPAGPDTVPDALVRLRRPAAAETGRQASGEA